MTKGEGSLSKLERLKAEYGPRFKAAAPKRRKIGQECLDVLCVQAIGKAEMGKDGLLRIKSKWCNLKRCPREKADGSDLDVPRI